MQSINANTNSNSAIMAEKQNSLTSSFLYGNYDISEEDFEAMAAEAEAEAQAKMKERSAAGAIATRRTARRSSRSKMDANLSASLAVSLTQLENKREVIMDDYNNSMSSIMDDMNVMNDGVKEEMISEGEDNDNDVRDNKDKQKPKFSRRGSGLSEATVEEDEEYICEELQAKIATRRKAREEKRMKKKKAMKAEAEAEAAAMKKEKAMVEVEEESDDDDDDSDFDDVLTTLYKENSNRGSESSGESKSSDDKKKINDNNTNTNNYKPTPIIKKTTKSKSSGAKKGGGIYWNNNVRTFSASVGNTQVVEDVHYQEGSMRGFGYDANSDDEKEKAKAGRNDSIDHDESGNFEFFHEEVDEKVKMSYQNVMNNKRGSSGSTVLSDMLDEFTFDDNNGNDDDDREPERHVPVRSKKVQREKNGRGKAEKFSASLPTNIRGSDNEDDANQAQTKQSPAKSKERSKISRSSGNKKQGHSRHRSMTAVDSAKPNGRVKALNSSMVNFNALAKSNGKGDSGSPLLSVQGSAGSVGDNKKDHHATISSMMYSA